MLVSPVGDLVSKTHAEDSRSSGQREVTLAQGLFCGRGQTVPEKDFVKTVAAIRGETMSEAKQKRGGEKFRDAFSTFPSGSLTRFLT